MNDPEKSPEQNEIAPTPDPLRLQQMRERVLHEYSAELLIKKIIWWVCAGLQAVAIVGSIVFLFRAESTAGKLLCVVIALIAHEGMVVVVLWVLMTSLRTDMLRQLKGMELQLAEFRTRGPRHPRGDEDAPSDKT
jgi:hypothetical protein